MLLTLIIAATIGQQPAWYPISNCPEWQGFGFVRSNNVITPQRWRQTANPGVEWIADGDQVPDGYTKVQDRTGAIGDPYGFVNWLCAQRAAVGLPGVTWDDGMAGAAAANNALQVVYGIGHWTMAGATRQNSAAMEWPGFLNAWLGSPGHRAALLDPTIRWVGLAGSGIYWTFSAR